jgi:tRNA modification GTPase
MTSNPRNLLARLTPPGSAAIATLALGGPDAGELLRQLFRPMGATKDTEAFRLGLLGDDRGADEVVVAHVGDAPFPRYEIHCHGGMQVVSLLEEMFAELTVRVCTWPEFLAAAGTDPLQVMAVQALGEATTVCAAAVLLDQYHGAFGRAVREVRAAVAKNDFDMAQRQVEGLARWAALGGHLTRPWRVVIAGAPNVGKSTLINRLTGYQRSVVAPVPGTTRDVVTARVAVDGWPVEFVDTAGIREDGEKLESMGIGYARAAAQEADLCLWLLDVSAPPVLPPPDFPPVVLVANKVDLPHAWDLNDIPDLSSISAESGAGMDELLRLVSRRLVPETPAPGAAVPFTPELGAELQAALAACRQGQWPYVADALERISRGEV